jgi:hypothetical protein
MAGQCHVRTEDRFTSRARRAGYDGSVNKLAIDADTSHIGLCLNCEYARRVKAKESGVYFLCERSLTDPTFPKYPRLPVRQCTGYANFQDAERHETVSIPTAPATTEKKCPCCGKPFTCHQQQGCWCANMRLTSATLDALRARFADCLCEACIRKETFQSPPLGSGPE